MLVPVTVMTALAETGTEVAFDMTSLMTTSVSSIQTQLFTAMNIVVPAIVSITAVVVTVKFGLKWLKKITG
ncbi:MAG: hypothetical protein HDR14_14755 [Lachnospiraceae bacterium]|nr:hypothetical protein [Lachnospiraceae bacterium]